MRLPRSAEYTMAVALSAAAFAGCGGKSTEQGSFDRTRQALIEYCAAWNAAPGSPEADAARDQYARALEEFKRVDENDVGFPPPIEGGAPVEDDGECVLPIADGPEDTIAGAGG